MEMDIDLILLLGAGCLAALIIAICIKLAGRPKPPDSASAQTDPSQQDESQFEQFKHMAAEQPNNPTIWLAWGRELLAAGAAAKHPNMRLHRYNEACSCFQSATEIDSSSITAWQLWGHALYALYRHQDGEDRRLLDNGHTKFQTAVKLSPDDAALWQHWGEELYMVAQCLLPDQALELQDLADARFARAVELNPELILEWKKWKGGHLQRMRSQDSPDPDPNAQAAPETAGPDGSAALQDKAQGT